MFEVIKQFTEWEIEEVTRFYAESCKNIPYFQKMFNTVDCTEQIYTSFKPDVTAAIRQGGCFGLYAGGILRAILLSVDWYKYKYDYTILFEHMFPKEEKSTEAIDKFINDGDGTIFIFAVATQSKFQAKGYATKLIKKFNSIVKKGNRVVSDCTDPSFNTMWLKNGYQLIEVDTDGEKLILAERNM